MGIVSDIADPQVARAFCAINSTPPPTFRNYQAEMKGAAAEKEGLAILVNDAIQSIWGSFASKRVMDLQHELGAKKHNDAEVMIIVQRSLSHRKLRHLSVQLKGVTKAKYERSLVVARQLLACLDDPCNREAFDQHFGHEADDHDLKPIMDWVVAAYIAERDGDVPWFISVPDATDSDVATYFWTHNTTWRIIWCRYLKDACNLIAAGIENAVVLADLLCRITVSC